MTSSRCLVWLTYGNPGLGSGQGKNQRLYALQILYDGASIRANKCRNRTRAGIQRDLMQAGDASKAREQAAQSPGNERVEEEQTETLQAILNLFFVPVCITLYGIPAGSPHRIAHHGADAGRHSIRDVKDKLEEVSTPEEERNREIQELIAWQRGQDAGHRAHITIRGQLKAPADSRPCRSPCRLRGAKPLFQSDLHVPHHALVVPHTDAKGEIESDQGDDEHGYHTEKILTAQRDGHG